MPSFAITGIANRLFHRKKESVQNKDKEKYREGSFDSNGSFGSQPTEEVLNEYNRYGDSSEWSDADEDLAPGEKVERGVKHAQAIASVWTRKSLVLAYAG